MSDNRTVEHDLQHEITTKRPTVEELLKMLSGHSTSRPSPPPVPPKPKQGFEVSIEAARRSLGLLSDTKKTTATTAAVSPKATKSDIGNKTFLVESGGDEVDCSDDCSSNVIPDPIRKHDTHTDLTSPFTRHGFYENNQPSATSVTKITATPRAGSGSVVYISSSSSSSETTHPQRQQPTANNGGHHHQKRLSYKPIVTELPDESNNNNNIASQQASGSSNKHNTSTVEILEVTLNGQSLSSSSRDNHDCASNKQQRVANTRGGLINKSGDEHNPHQANLHRGDSAFAAANLAVVTTTGEDCYNQYDDGDDDDLCVDGGDAQLAKEVETILSDSLSDPSQPPRTSTPTPTSSIKLYHSHHQLLDSTNSSSGASNATSNNNNNNNRSSQQNAYISQHTSNTRGDVATRLLPASSDNNFGEEDPLNISRETDELTADTSVHNQSGCELVGVNDNSDSKNSPRKIEQQQQPQQDIGQDVHQATPYTVQFFNDTLISPGSGSSSSQPENNNSQNSQNSSTGASSGNNKRLLSNKCEMSINEMESNSLKKLVRTLQDQVERLNNKVSGLTCEVEDLKSELDRQKRDGTLLSASKSTTSIFSATASEQHAQQRNNQDSTTYQSPMGTLHKLSPLSQSVSTINKLTPMKTSKRNNNSTYGLMSTYSRSGTSQQQQGSASTGGGGCGHPSSHLLSTNARRSQVTPQQQQQSSYSSNSSSMSRQAQMRKSNIHTSTNSLYAESHKSGSTSVSPTPLGDSISTINSSRQYASPSSYLNLTQKRDPSSYTSMLSLSSLGTTSTLKKASNAGSVSNLSQFGSSQVSSWPSMSNFITSKHQAKDILYDEEEQIIRMVLYNTLITMRVPSWLGADYCIDQIIEAPPVKLKLDWVHGYRGRDCRSNIYYLPTGECVYFVAAIVVLYNPEEKTQRHYLGHTDSVKCLAVHPNKLIVASGQSAIANRRDKRPIVRVWNTVSLATLRVIGFNEDFDRSICCLAFSKHDAGATLAVVDESSEHTITLLDWQREKNWRVAEVNSGHEPVLAVDFHPIDKYSLVAVGKSSINFWDIRGMTLAKKAGLFDKYDRPKYVLCMTFNDLGETITGDSNGNIIIWPRGTNKPRRIIRDIHPGGVFSVLAMKDGSYLTGGRDRRIVEWDESFEMTGRQAELPEHCGGVRFITCARGSQVLIGTLRNSILIGSLDSAFQVIMQGHTEATTALAVHPCLPKYLTGGFDDQIQLIDAHTHELEWSKCLAMPITAASFSPNGLILILGSTSGNWLALDAITQEILFTACDGTGNMNCIKFSQDGLLLAMGSSDCHLYIYETTPSGNTFCRIGTCVGHSAPVKEIDWSDDNSYIQSQSMNFELLFWKAHNCRPVDSDVIVHDLKWTTHNCTIGFNVIGIWSDSIDSALINYCDKSNNDKYIISATDTGYLNIYKWPTYYNQCSSQKYFGNVDKFSFTKFLSDDSRIIAVGAKSCATTVWSIVEETD